MDAFVQLIAAGKVDVQRLISHRIPIDEAARAYDLITGKLGEPFLGVVLTYPEMPDLRRDVPVRSPGSPAPRADFGRGVAGRIRLGMIGTGNFANATMLPALKALDSVDLVAAASAGGMTARVTAERFGFARCTTDVETIFADPAINTVAILTRHHLHARQVCTALAANKHVFCEKPLCLNEHELADVIQAYERAQQQPQGLQASPMVMVGYNRRFAPMAQQLRAFLRPINEPLMMHYRINAGYIPPEHWVHDPAQGGGRIIGEVCHFVDFLMFLTGMMPARVSARALPNGDTYHDDNVAVTLEFADGSLGTITYVASGDKLLPKERVEIFGGGSVAILDDFRRLELIRQGRTKTFTSRLRQDKGHRAEWEAFARALQSDGAAPIPFHELVASTLCTFRINDALRTGQAEDITLPAGVTTHMNDVPSHDVENM